MDDSQPLTLFVEQIDLTEPEQDRLIDLEATIERGLKTFVEVGTALLVIRDSRLYRQDYSTFEDYCRERWGMSRPRAYQLIEAAEVSQNLSTTVDILPQSERQARPLTRLEPEQQREAWQEAVESAPNGKVTAAHVESIARRYIPAEPTEDDEATPEEVAAYEEWKRDPSTARPWEEFKAELEDECADEPEPEPPSKMSVHFSSDTPEHYTPDEIIDAVLACMGAIDLDPCSNSHETPHVPAQSHYTMQDDGLVQFWQGRVFLNPPYGRQIGDWIDKLCESYETGDVTEAIALVPARTDTAWWVRLNTTHPFVCFVRRRLTFVGNENAAPFPSAVIYLGENIGTFYNTFSEFGDIYQRLHPEMFGT